MNVAADYRTRRRSQLGGKHVSLGRPQTKQITRRWRDARLAILLRSAACIGTRRPFHPRTALGCSPVGPSAPRTLNIPPKELREFARVCLRPDMYEGAAVVKKQIGGERRAARSPAAIEPALPGTPLRHRLPEIGSSSFGPDRLWYNP